MKIIYKIIRNAILTVLPGVLLHSCTSDTSIAGGTTETTSANVIGTIRYEESNIRAAGVTVKLIPAGYNPYIDSGIDSVVTNEQGKYAFKISKSGYFNLYAQSQDKFCYTDSIFCQETKLTVVNTTLKAYGSVQGKIRVPANGQLSDILILVIGTNTYTTPDSITGSFSIPFLAEGVYTFRILSPEKLYEYIDTIVNIVSGKKSTLPEILIPFTDIPELEAMQTEFNNKTMQLSLSWSPQDTSDIAGYYIFRNSSITDTPLAIVNNSDTVFQDDLLLLTPDSLPFKDTIRYCVAAIGKDRTFRKLSSVQKILLKSSLITVDTVSIPVSLKTEDLTFVHFDKNSNYYLYCRNYIVKFNSMNQVVAQYTAQQIWPGTMSVDRNGYVLLFNASIRKFIKLTPDLKIIKESKKLTFLPDPPIPGNLLIISKNDDQIDLLCYDYHMKILSFDSTFTLKSSRSVVFPGSSDSVYGFNNLIICNDSLFFRRHHQIPNKMQSLLEIYDVNNNLVKTLDGNTIVPKTPQTAIHLFDYYLYSESNNLLVYYRNPPYPTRDALFILNPDYTLYGRAAIHGYGYFDGVSKWYTPDAWNCKIYIHTIN